MSNDVPEALLPYAWFGIEFEFRSGETNATGNCPFCDKRKFAVNLHTGVYRCWVCAKGTDRGGGNAFVFLRELYQTMEPIKGDAYKEIQADTLTRWGVRRLGGTLYIPGYGIKGQLNQLYRVADKLYPVPTLGHQIHGVNLFSPAKNKVYVCEGPWDAMALWEKLRTTKQGEVRTGNEKASLLADANIIAVPGANVWKDSWNPLLQDKDVVLMFDSDYPNKRTKKSAGFEGMKRVTKLLMNGQRLPSSVSYLRWGKGGYDEEKPNNYDVRDYVQEGGTCTKLLKRIKEAPERWYLNGEVSGKGKPSSSPTIGVAECTEWKTLITSWRKALRWTEGLNRGLAVMLATVASTKTVGDQLWVKIIGPPSCGKSTLCEALTTNSEYCIAKSTIRGFHSGYRTGEGEEEDNSLIAQINGKTLITKDGDTLLTSPNLPQILAEGRDLYDSVSRSHYRNKASRDYTGIRMTWLLCGTASLRSIDHSELGERFLDCVIMDHIEDELEDEILWRVVNRSDRSICMESGETTDGMYEPELAKAMSLTGGYVSYLRENALELLSQVTASEQSLKAITRLGKFVAFMRARPTEGRDSETREFAARLVTQHHRLAKCLAVVFNRNTLDAKVMDAVARVSLDTSRGISLDILEELYQEKEGVSLTIRGLAGRIQRDQAEVRLMCKFLRRIRVLDIVKRKGRRTNAVPEFKLTQSIRDIFNVVYGLLKEE